MPTCTLMRSSTFRRSLPSSRRSSSSDNCPNAFGMVGGGGNAKIDGGIGGGGGIAGNMKGLNGNGPGGGGILAFGGAFSKLANGLTTEKD